MPRRPEALPMIDSQPHMAAGDRSSDDLAAILEVMHRQTHFEVLALDREAGMTQRKLYDHHLQNALAGFGAVVGEGRGPLEGLLAGLSALPETTEVLSGRESMTLE